PKSWADICEEEDLQRKKNDKKLEEEINNRLQEAKNGQPDQQKNLVDEQMGKLVYVIFDGPMKDV
ncbi:hypothetical protein A2U01_0084861, partial [Trifolium medium]|nr:hypothetical protein [Trifolium medium]